MTNGDIGAWFVKYVLDLAFQLTGSESAPGVVSLLLIVILIALSVSYIWKTSRFRQAVRAGQAIVQVEDEGLITRESRIPIDRAFKHIGKKKGPERFLAIAWKEFAETTVGVEDERSRLRNTTRPSTFFTREGIDRELKIWRQIPAIFVSVGLLLTFLGLVSALDRTGEVLDSASASRDTTEGLKTLLQVASAKFIMSLTGLFCSILFIFVLRFCESKKEEVLIDLCDAIERGCLFQDEQTLLNKILTQSQEQTHQLQSFSTELVAQVARPLKEELPNAIHEAFQQHMAPALAQIAKNTGAGIESLVETVSQQLSGGMQDSAQAIKDEMDTVRSTLETVTKRLEASGDRMATGINGAVDSLRQNLLDPMDALVAQIQEFASQILAATNQTGQYAQTMEESTASIVSTNAQFRQASNSLVSAVTPVRDAVGRIETASNAMGERIEEAIRAFTTSVHETAAQTQSAVQNAQEALDASRTVMQDSVNSVRNAAEQFSHVLDRYAEIDASLGSAFKQIETAVSASIENIKKFQDHLDEKFADALGRLETLIARTEPFEPRHKQ